MNLCWISCRNTSTKAVIVSPNISGSAEGSHRSLDPISRTKMSGFVALVALRSYRISLSTVATVPISLTRQEFFKSKCLLNELFPALFFRKTFILCMNEWPSINDLKRERSARSRQSFRSMLKQTKEWLYLTFLGVKSCDFSVAG